jgi:hypothetical protein
MGGTRVVLGGTVDVVVVVVVVRSVVVVVPGATVDVVVEEEEVDVGIVVVVGTTVVVVVEVEVDVEVVVVDAATVVVVVAGAAGMTVAVMVDEPVIEARRAWITPAVVIDDEPVTTIGVSGASMPEFARANFEEPSTVMSALFPGAKLIEGVAGVLPFNVNCDEPVTTTRPPVSLLHARISFNAVLHARTSRASVPATLDELVTFNEPANQYIPGSSVTFDEPPKVMLRYRPGFSVAVTEPPTVTSRYRCASGNVNVPEPLSVTSR